MFGIMEKIRRKSRKIVSKNVLTNGGLCGILSSSRVTRNMILENDTESRRTRDCDFHESRSNKDSQFVK